MVPWSVETGIPPEGIGHATARGKLEPSNVPEQTRHCATSTGDRMSSPWRNLGPVPVAHRPLDLTARGRSSQVFRAMPREFLAQDPKQKKAAKSMAKGKRAKVLREAGRRAKGTELAGRTPATPPTAAGVGGKQEEPAAVSAEPPPVVA